jgi:hypothetical protein
MSNTDITGPGGGVTQPTGCTGHIAAWSATVEMEDVETTGFAEVGNRTFDATTVMMSGAYVGTGQSAAGSTTLLPATALGATPAMSAWQGTLTLTATTGCTFSFNALIKAVALNRPQNGKLDIAYTFKSSGPITQTWNLT